MSLPGSAISLDPPKPNRSVSESGRSSAGRSAATNTGRGGRGKKTKEIPDEDLAVVAPRKTQRTDGQVKKCDACPTTSDQAEWFEYTEREEKRTIIRVPVEPWVLLLISM